MIFIDIGLGGCSGNKKYDYFRSCVCMISIWVSLVSRLVVCKFTFCDILIIKIEDSKIQIMNFLFCGAKFTNSTIVKKQKIFFNTCFDSSESFSIECEVSCCCLSFCSFSIFLGRSNSTGFHLILFLNFLPYLYILTFHGLLSYVCCMFLFY